MSSKLVVCGACGRHVFRRESCCPFCRSLLPRTRQGILAVVALTVAGCGGAGPEPVSPTVPQEPPIAAEEDFIEEEGEVPPPVVEPETDPGDDMPPAVVMYGPPPDMD